MARSRFSLHSPDLRDVVSAIQAFEEINQVVLMLSLRTQVEKETEGVWLVGMVFQGNKSDQEAQLLVSEKLRCSDTTWTSLDVAAFRLLYALDSALAFREMQGGERRL